MVCKSNLGNINIEKTYINRHIVNDDYECRLERLYQDALDSQPTNGMIADTLSRYDWEGKTSKVNGQLLKTLGGSRRFDLNSIKKWYLQMVNLGGVSREEGVLLANQKLDKYLSEDPYINVEVALWLVGVTVNEDISLDDEFTIKPIENMVDCNVKEYLLRHRVDGLISPQLPKECCAIVKKVQMLKYSMHDYVDNMPVETKWATVENKKLEAGAEKVWNDLADLGLLLNVVKNVVAISKFHSSYSSETPFCFGGAKSGSGFFMPSPRVIVNPVLSSEQVEALKKIWGDFNKIKGFGISENDKIIRYRIGVQRLCKAKTIFSDKLEDIQNCLLELCIALEMILSDKSDGSDSPTSKFRSRGAWLLGSNYESRERIYNQLKKLYKYRSDIVHTGRMKLKGNNDLKSLMQSCFSYAERLYMLRLRDCFRDIKWDSVILGGSSR